MVWIQYHVTVNSPCFWWERFLIPETLLANRATTSSITSSSSNDTPFHLFTWKFLKFYSHRRIAFWNRYWTATRVTTTPKYKYENVLKFSPLSFVLVWLPWEGSVVTWVGRRNSYLWISILSVQKSVVPMMYICPLPYLGNKRQSVVERPQVSFPNLQSSPPISHRILSYLLLERATE